MNFSEVFTSFRFLIGFIHIYKKVLHFTVFELDDHLVCQTVSARLHRNLIPSEPFCQGQFLAVECDFFLTIQITIESHQERITERPGLTFIVTNIFNFQPDFFHDGHE